MKALIDQELTIDFTTHNPLTGNVSDADFPPTCTVYEQDTDIPILTLVPVVRAGTTGSYRVTFVVSTVSGFEEGKTYNVIADVTVAGVNARARIALLTVASKPIHYRV